VFFSLRKQLLFKPRFLARGGCVGGGFFSSFLFFFFFFLKDFERLGYAILPSDAVQEFQRKFPDISFVTSFLALAAVLNFFAFCI